MRILLLEDNAVLSDILDDYLSDHYNIDKAFTAKEALSLVEQKRYDLFIFDVNIPDKNGIALLKELRGFNITTPAIIVTAYEDTAHLKAGFDAGAHDYICKPFALEELFLRIENSKRLFNIEQHRYITLSAEYLYNPENKTIENTGTVHTLTPKDAAILDYFIAHSGRTISSEELVRNLWDFDHLPCDATLRSHIRRLRELIGNDKIVTVHGIGYRYK